MVSVLDSDVPELNVLDPGYRPDGPHMQAARAANWYARTPIGIAVLRYDQIGQLLTDRRPVQGTHRELRYMVAALLFAGQDTTRHQLGRAMALFERHPDQWAVLAEQPELADRAIAEVLRRAPTVTGTGRLATADIEFGGTVIPAGTMVTLDFHAGNTDPEVFGPDTDTLDIAAARPAPPLTFGAGIHYCLGANLARAELAEALPVLASRLGPVTLDGDPQWRPALGITGPVTLPLRFTAR